MSILIADSGATKCDWILLSGTRKKRIVTRGINPYFLLSEEVAALLQRELVPHVPRPGAVSHIYYYGTGMLNPANVTMVQNCMKQVFTRAVIEIDDDLLSAARSLNGAEKGMTCNLGTGSFCCFYDGKKITRRAPGLGFILGDEGSGAYLGKKTIQYYLYKTFDEDLHYKFDSKFSTDRVQILESVYRKPQPNQYLASFAPFLTENRGHYMVENILEDGINDFFFQHLCKFNESWKYPVHFTGGISFAFKDIIRELCRMYGFDLGKIEKTPINGLVRYHSQQRS